VCYRLKYYRDWYRMRYHVGFMGRASKVLEAARKNPSGVSFADLRALVEAAGWALKRTRGSHRIFSRPGTIEIVNLQEDGKSAKSYQVRQVLDLIDKYKIEIP